MEQEQVAEIDIACGLVLSPSFPAQASANFSIHHFSETFHPINEQIHKEHY